MMMWPRSVITTRPLRHFQHHPAIRAAVLSRGFASSIARMRESLSSSKTFLWGWTDEIPWFWWRQLCFPISFLSLVFKISSHLANSWRTNCARWIMGLGRFAGLGWAEQKIVVQNPVVELDGDEMTRIIWKKIREEVRTMIFFSPSSTQCRKV